MPICIECRHPVKTLWTKYSNADDKSSGHNIRLTVCRNCGHFCDKYVEHDFVVLFIDLVLIKPQVYRHLLHNTLMKDDDRFDVSHRWNSRHVSIYKIFADGVSYLVIHRTTRHPSVTV